MTFVAYVLKIILLTELLTATNFVFYLCPKLFYFFGFNYWIQHYKFEPYPESCQTSKIERFVENSKRLLDFWQGSEYVSDIRQPALSVQKWHED